MTRSSDLAYLVQQRERRASMCAAMPPCQSLAAAHAYLQPAGTRHLGRRQPLGTRSESRCALGASTPIGHHYMLP